MRQECGECWSNYGDFFYKTRCKTRLSHRGVRCGLLFSFHIVQLSTSFTFSAVIQSFSENKLRLLSRQWRSGEKIAIACSPHVIRLADACSAGNCGEWLLMRFARLHGPSLVGTGFYGLTLFGWEEVVGGEWRCGDGEKRERWGGFDVMTGGRGSLMDDVITIRELVMFFSPLSLVCFSPSLPWPLRALFSLDHYT